MIFLLDVMFVAIFFVTCVASVVMAIGDNPSASFIAPVLHGLCAVLSAVLVVQFGRQAREDR